MPDQEELGLDQSARPGLDEVLIVRDRQASEVEALRHAGPPFYILGWGRNAMGLRLDDATDWDEVAELVVESYCVLAPRKLVALVERPHPI